MTALRILLSFLAGIIGIILIIIGLITAITPVPLGLPLALVGVVMLAGGAPAMLRWIRKRWKWLDTKLRALEKRLPRWMARKLRDSDPASDNDDETDETASTTLHGNNTLSRRKMARDLLRRR